MKAVRVAAVARKEFLHIRRDPRSLLLGIGLPLLLLLLFGYALTLDVDNVPLAVWDQSETPESRELIARFDGSRYFEVRRHVVSYPEIEQAMDTGDTAVVERAHAVAIELRREPRLRRHGDIARPRRDDEDLM